MIRRAGAADFETVRRITRRTIDAVFPKYYPEGAVQLFRDHHSDACIRRDIADGIVFLLADEGEDAGTVTVRGNEICRLFVLPEHQGRGCGRALLEYAEARIAERFDTVTMDVSLPAKGLYLKHGYREVSWHTTPTKNGDFLCYDVMQKKIGG